jgi:hypothetical protein
MRPDAPAIAMRRRGGSVGDEESVTRFSLEKMRTGHQAEES